MIEFAQLGCKVDVSSNAAAIWGEARCDKDAVVVHQIVRAVPVERRALIIRHGLQRSAPEWNPLIMPLRYIPVPGREGANKGIYVRENNNRSIGTVVTYAGDWSDRETAALARAYWPEGEPHLRCAEEVNEYARAVYLEWIMGLIELEDWLDGESGYYCLCAAMSCAGSALRPIPGATKHVAGGEKRDFDQAAGSRHLVSFVTALCRTV